MFFFGVACWVSSVVIYWLAEGVIGVSCLPQDNVLFLVYVAVSAVFATACALRCSSLVLYWGLSVALVKGISAGLVVGLYLNVGPQG